MCDSYATPVCKFRCAKLSHVVDCVRLTLFRANDGIVP